MFADAVLLWARLRKLAPRVRGLLALCATDKGTSGGLDAAGTDNNDISEMEKFRRDLQNSRQESVDLVGVHDVNAKFSVLLLAIQAQQALLTGILWIGSDDWERREEALCALAAISGSRYNRQYRVQTVYKEVLEKRYIEDVSSLLSNEERWALIPKDQRTSRLNCLAFRTLSAGAGYCRREMMGPASCSGANRTYRLAFEALEAGSWDVFAKGLEDRNHVSCVCLRS